MCSNTLLSLLHSGAEASCFVQGFQTHAEYTRECHSAPAAEDCFRERVVGAHALGSVPVRLLFLMLSSVTEGKEPQASGRVPAAHESSVVGHS